MWISTADMMSLSLIEWVIIVIKLSTKCAILLDMIGLFLKYLFLYNIGIQWRAGTRCSKIRQEMHLCPQWQRREKLSFSLIHSSWWKYLPWSWSTCELHWYHCSTVGFQWGSALQLPVQYLHSWKDRLEDNRTSMWTLYTGAYYRFIKDLY